MLTVYLENVGAVTLPIPQGSLAAGANTTVSLELLLRSSYYYQSLLSAQITAGDLLARFNGCELTDTQMQNLPLTVAQLGSAAGDPVLDGLDVAGGAAMAAAGGDVKLVGRNLLQGGLLDGLTLTEGGASLLVEALKPGVSGISVEMTVGAGGLVVTYAAKKLSIELAAGGSTDDAIATEINKDGGVAEGILRANSAGGGSFTLAQAEAPLAGGAGDYDGYEVQANGGEALPANEPGATSTAKWTDTGVTCTTPAGGAATDVATVSVKANGISSKSLSAVLV